MWIWGEASRPGCPGGTYVEPWQQFALAIISTAVGDRPVFFASSGNAAGQLGLTPFLVRQGLAFRLHEGPIDPEAMGEVVELRPSAFTNVTGVYLDARRTQRLASEVFIHRNGLPDEWPRWPWRAVLGIPSYYSWVHYALYEWANMQNDGGRGWITTWIGSRPGPGSARKVSGPLGVPRRPGRSEGRPAPSPAAPGSRRGRRKTPEPVQQPIPGSGAIPGESGTGSFVEGSGLATGPQPPSCRKDRPGRRNRWDSSLLQEAPPEPS